MQLVGKAASCLDCIDYKGQQPCLLGADYPSRMPLSLDTLDKNILERVMHEIVSRMLLNEIDCVADERNCEQLLLEITVLGLKDNQVLHYNEKFELRELELWLGRSLFQ